MDLSRFRLTDESAGTDWRFELSGMLAPGEVRVFYGSVSDAEIGRHLAVDALDFFASNLGDYALSIARGTPTLGEQTTRCERRCAATTGRA